ncbi:Protein Shroom2 [Dissostichus eleginoides]|uniref:Protein Shroom2 n=1 Tax=Dissostichus eleginoides TaxID=100907 RepID=A0AAD9C8J2_DISEL|nr:Protein Shroom2 [Dissostichus eleginoides]
MKMMDIVAQKTPSEDDVNVARSFLTKILRSSMRRNQPISRPHSWHSTKFNENQSETAKPQAPPTQVWHTINDASSSSDLSSGWDQTPPLRVSDQFSSHGSMDSLDQVPPPSGPLSPPTSSMEEHLGGKRDSAYSSFSTSSGTPDYTLYRSIAASTENMVHQVSQWEAGGRNPRTPPSLREGHRPEDKLAYFQMPGLPSAQTDDPASHSSRTSLGPTLNHKAFTESRRAHNRRHLKHRTRTRTSVAPTGIPPIRDTTTWTVSVPKPPTAGGSYCSMQDLQDLNTNSSAPCGQNQSRILSSSEQISDSSRKEPQHRPPAVSLQTTSLKTQAPQHSPHSKDSNGYNIIQVTTGLETKPSPEDRGLQSYPASRPPEQRRSLPPQDFRHQVSNKICPQDTPMLHSLSMDAAGQTEKTRVLNPEESIEDQQARRSDRFATTLRNQIQMRRANLQKSTSSLPGAEADEDQEVWRPEGDPPSSADRSFTSSYKDHLKEAQARVLKATSFRRRDLVLLEATAAEASQNYRKEGPPLPTVSESVMGKTLGGPVTRIGGRKRFPAEKKVRSFSEPDKIHQVGVKEDPPRNESSLLDQNKLLSGKPVLHSTPAEIPSETRARGLCWTPEPKEDSVRVLNQGDPAHQPVLDQHLVLDQQRLGTFAEYEAQWNTQKNVQETRSSGRYRSAENILDPEGRRNPTCLHERSRSSPSAQRSGQILNTSAFLWTFSNVEKCSPLPRYPGGICVPHSSTGFKILLNSLRQNTPDRKQSCGSRAPSAGGPHRAAPPPSPPLMEEQCPPSPRFSPQRLSEAPPKEEDEDRGQRLTGSRPSAGTRVPVRILHSGGGSDTCPYLQQPDPPTVEAPGGLAGLGSAGQDSHCSAFSRHTDPPHRDHLTPTPDHMTSNSLPPAGLPCREGETSGGLGETNSGGSGGETPGLSEDQRREALARVIVGKDKSLAEVLDRSHMKTTMDLMEGIFPGGGQLLEGGNQRRKVPPKQPSGPPAETREQDSMAASVSMVTSSSYYSTSAPKAELLIMMKDMREEEEEEEELDSEEELDIDLAFKKQQLMQSLSRKLSVLQEAQQSLQEDVQDNNALGGAVEAQVQLLCKPNEIEKFRMFVGDLDKVVSLLLSLSGRLARVENAIDSLEEDAPPRRGAPPHERRLLTDKRNVLIRQHEDAKELKENLDRRERLVFDILSLHLHQDLLTDYQHFVKMKSALLIEQRKLEDKIKLGEEQLRGLKESLENRTSF